MSEENQQNETPSEKPIDALKELLEPTYPLLAKFKDLCPGSYKHSQNLASMIETIAVDLKLHVTFMKVAATYHDIGKMFNPKYFTENQLEDENPHEKLDPRVSYQIISRHVSDTALILLGDQNFPRDLIQIAVQHHGSSVMKYFFDKSGGDIEELYRYKSEKPTCVESAVLMICDYIEARSRSEVQAGSFDPTEVIEDTINQLLSDGQLDDVVMRLGDLQKIKDALARELEGSFQKRVDYRKAKEETKKMEENETIKQK